MHKKNIALEFEIDLPAYDCTDGAQEELIALLLTISSELSMNPTIYTNENNLWIYYGHSYFQCEILLNDLLYSIAYISHKYPISIYGCANGIETAQIILEVGNDKVKVQKLNVSGQDFSELYDLCLRISCPDQEQLKMLNDILQGIDYRHDFLLIKRNAFTNQSFTHYPDLDKNTYFRYLPLRPIDELDLDRFSYTLKQQVDLWLLLLIDGVSAVEFSVLMNKLEMGCLNSFFTWELSLRFALQQANIKITYDDNGFIMQDRNGKRILYDYVHGSPAQQLLLKIIFPAPPLHR